MEFLNAYSVRSTFSTNSTGSFSELNGAPRSCLLAVVVLDILSVLSEKLPAPLWFIGVAPFPTYRGPTEASSTARYILLAVHRAETNWYILWDNKKSFDI